MMKEEKKPMGKERRKGKNKSYYSLSVSLPFPFSLSLSLYFFHTRPCSPLAFFSFLFHFVAPIDFGSRKNIITEQIKPVFNILN